MPKFNTQVSFLYELTSPYEIEYESGRIKAYRGNTFTYISDGARIKKENTLKTHEYTVEGNIIIKEKIITSNGVYELFYNYDQYGELLCVELNGNIYFYFKDTLGIILKLVDENGNTVVSYGYSKILEGLDKKYENEKKEWFEQICD